MAVTPTEFGLTSFAFPTVPAEQVSVDRPLVSVRRLVIHRDHPRRIPQAVPVTSVTVVNNIIVNSPRVVR